MKKLIDEIYKELDRLQNELGRDLKLGKFGMSHSTLDMFKASSSIEPRKLYSEFVYRFLDCIIEVDDDIPENKVEVHCDDIMFSVWVTEYQISNSSEFGDLTMMQSQPRIDPYIATGRTFRTCLDVIKTASESNEGDTTFLVVNNFNEVKECSYRLYGLLSGSVGDHQGSTRPLEKNHFALHGNRFIRVITKKQACEFQGDKSKFIYDHTVRDRFSYYINTLNV